MQTHTNNSPDIAAPYSAVQLFLGQLRTRDRAEVAAALAQVAEHDRLDVARHALAFVYPHGGAFYHTTVVEKLHQLSAYHRTVLMHHIRELAPAGANIADQWCIAIALTHVTPAAWTEIAQSTRAIVRARAETTATDVHHILYALADTQKSLRAQAAQWAQDLGHLSGEHIGEILCALNRVAEAERNNVFQNAMPLITPGVDPIACRQIIEGLSATPSAERAWIARLVRPLIPQGVAFMICPASSLIHALSRLPPGQRERLAMECLRLQTKRLLTLQTLSQEMQLIEGAHLNDD